MSSGRRDVDVLACLKVKGGAWDGLENETQTPRQDPEASPDTSGNLVCSEQALRDGAVVKLGRGSRQSQTIGHRRPIRHAPAERAPVS